jgi:hypothetical protein
VPDTELDDLRDRLRRTRWPERETVAGWEQGVPLAYVQDLCELGYERYGAEGSDWGTSVTATLGRHDRAHLAGIHLVPPLAPPDPATLDALTERERAALDALEQAAEWDSGYSQEQGTRPQTIGYAPVDSPAALCAWIVEKFWAWTDH